MRLVYLFNEHIAAVARVAELERQLEILTERYTQSLKDLATAQTALEAMQTHIQANPSHLTGMVDLFNKYQEHVLQESPFVDNKIPDDYWLTGQDAAPREELDG